MRKKLWLQKRWHAFTQFLKLSLSRPKLKKSFSGWGMSWEVWNPLHLSRRYTNASAWGQKILHWNSLQIYPKYQKCGRRKNQKFDFTECFLVFDDWACGSRYLVAISLFLLETTKMVLIKCCLASRYSETSQTTVQISSYVLWSKLFTDIRKLRIKSLRSSVIIVR